ncbi:hypothetical protein NliqN6_6145 [Naganishia liquefaciens]|uniref:Uncharacterized protein n=1 Tax=Naganishia liquefaciens TaxID=104408 RepID=A0A8H3TZ60_9TREE|nr:hypothetical protein NliqN6_6145 [Naganishia liquefaciens]
MGLLGSHDPVKAEEKHAKKEEKYEEKQLKQAEKELKKLEKEESKAEKDHQKALKDEKKAEKKHEKVEHKLEKAVDKHDNVAAHNNKASAVAGGREQRHAELENEITQKKIALEQAKQGHRENSREREERIHVLEHTNAAPGATTTHTIHPNGANGAPQTTSATVVPGERV